MSHSTVTVIFVVLVIAAIVGVAILTRYQLRAVKKVDCVLFRHGWWRINSLKDPIAQEGGTIIKVEPPAPARFYELYWHPIETASVPEGFPWNWEKVK